jgi:hypothetical protein
MSKRNKLIYWIATAWLALGMLSTGIVQLLHSASETELFTRLGYPVYFLTILGITKILGVAVVLIPTFTLLKEWAYAGFAFTMGGAIISHLVSGSPVGDLFGPLLLLILTLVSWYFRPADRKPVAAHH